MFQIRTFVGVLKYPYFRFFCKLRSAEVAGRDFFELKKSTETLNAGHRLSLKCLIQLVISIGILKHLKVNVVEKSLKSGRPEVLFQNL